MSIALPRAPLEPKPRAPVERFGLKAFPCLHCRALAQQDWFSVGAQEAKPPHIYRGQLGRPSIAIDGLPQAFMGTSVSALSLTRCFVCNQLTIWAGAFPAWPLVRTGLPLPSPDMPEEVRADFNEAALIFDHSPRAAAAILRLALEKLCRALGKTGTIDKMIGSLVADDLGPKLQKAFDFVRVIGNEAVHPGQIAVNDNPEIVAALFKLLNIIVEKTITEENQINELYSTLPPEKLAGIENRDKATKP